MQQLYLTGDGASASAAQLMNALNVPFSGFQLTPVRVGGSLRGEALHLLLPPPKPRLNDVLCRVRLTEKGWLLLPQVMEEIAAPGLCGTFSTRTPILIDRIEPEMLVCPAFCDALMQVQAREQLAIFVVADGAEKPLQQMMPENRQRWFPRPTHRRRRSWKRPCCGCNHHHAFLANSNLFPLRFKGKMGYTEHVRWNERSDEHA